MDQKIRELWNYISENLSKINWNILQKDIEIIKNYNNIENLNESECLYKQIYLLFKNINPDISFTLKNGCYLITDPEFIINQMMVRHEIILSVGENVNNFPLIEQIYNISKEYNILDVIVIKYYPQQLNTMMILAFKNVLLEPSVIKYRIQKIGMEQLDIVFTLNDDIIKKHIKSQSDISLLRNTFCIFLESLVSEFVVAIHIPKITILPETPHNITFPMEIKNLKPLTNITQDLQNLLPKFKKCEWCHLNENHSELLSIIKNEKEKYFCLYCYSCLNQIYDN